MVTKDGKVMTQCERLPPINSNNLLNLCSQEITWQIKHTVSPLSQDSWPQDLSGGVIPQGAPAHNFAWTLNGLVLQSHVINWIRYIFTCRRPMDTKISGERLQSLEPYDPFVRWHTWGHVMFWTFCISTIQILTAGKRGEGVGSARKWLSRHQLFV